MSFEITIIDLKKQLKDEENDPYGARRLVLRKYQRTMSQEEAVWQGMPQDGMPPEEGMQER